MSAEVTRKTRVLFVDDEIDVLLGLQMSLRKSPFEIIATTQPEEARFFLSSQPIDVFVCDERMPTVSGSELLATLRGNFPGTARILLTGHCDLPMAMRAIKQARLFRYLTKPVSATVLASAIRQAVFDRSLQGLPPYVRKARARFRLLKDLEHAYPGVTRELRIDGEQRVNPAEALLEALEEGAP